MPIDRTLFISSALASLLLAGCAPSALQMANNEADNATKLVPQVVSIQVPFDAAKAKSDLASGDRRISGVLYHRLDASGRDESGWPASPLIKNQPFGSVGIHLYPASPAVVAFDDMLSEHQSTMKSWYTNHPSAFNRLPQTKRFLLPPGTTKYSVEAKTDRFGRYSFNNLKPGRYYVFVEGWQSGSYNRSTYAGSSSYSDGTGVYGVRGTVHHNKLVPVNFKTFLYYAEFVDVTSGSEALDSRMKVDYNQMTAHYSR